MRHGMFTSMIRLSKSSLGHAEKQAVLRVLETEYLGMGDEVKAFEEQLTTFFGRTAVCVSTGTAALQLALQSIGVGVGDEVLVPTLTYVASFQAISATGALPVACDVLESSLLIDLDDARKRITPRTKALMPVHYAGNCENLDAIHAFAQEFNLRVVEDAAHAFGSSYHNQKIGSFGDLVCFSFDGIKNITSAEGGCVVSNDQSAVQNMRDARLLGVINDTESRYAGKRSWDFDVCNQGWRYHMSNINAAIGRVQLARSSEFFRHRQSIAKTYDRLLKDEKKIGLLPINYNDVVPHIYAIKLDSAVDKHAVMGNLNTSGVQTGTHYLPNHYLSLYKKSGLTLPVAEKIYPTLLTLPMHFDLSLSEVEYVCNVLKEAVNSD